MKEVFISYSSQDSTSAETVRDVLESNGLSCWMAPRDIPGGSDYTKEIPVAIRECTVFVLILSQHAQDSQWVLKELSSAVSAGRRCHMASAQAAASPSSTDIPRKLVANLETG